MTLPATTPTTPVRAVAPRRHATAIRLAALALAAATLALPACRPAAPAFGSDAAEARANSDAFFGAWAARFTNVQRTPKFDEARGRLGRYALAPSGVFGDTAVWTASTADTRTLTVSGRLRSNRYVFDASATAPAPRAADDSWRMTQLRRLGDDRWRWNTQVDLAVGGATPDQILAVERAILATGARSAEPLLRAQYRTGFPRTTAVMGKLATLDSIHRSPVGDGSAVVDLFVTITPDRLRASHPHFSQYLVKYVRPARYDVTFADRGGRRWVMSTLRNYRLFFRVRAMADGRLAPLDGVPRPMPDTLVMTGDFWAKFSIFTVGVTDLTADVAVLGSARERGWDFRFRKEPDWHFPLAVNNLIRTALRHPFEGNGMGMRLSAERRTDGLTLIRRHAEVSVQEGAIVRWLGGLGAGAMSDFSGRAEQDENRFLADLFSAMQDDFAALARGS